MLIDTLARQLGIRMDKLQHNAAIGRGRLCEKRVLLAKPMTFMNSSGESVGKLARYYKVRLPRSIVRIQLSSSELLQHTAGVGCGRLCKKHVLRAKPMTFMYNYGESLAKLARYYKTYIPPHLLSFYAP